LKKPVGRDAFIHGVLELLDQGKSLREITLRTVARHLECAHTNAYNWFESQEELYWYALAEALERLVAPFDPNHPERIPGPLESGGLFDYYIDFAFDHPAWFRLIWQEQLAGQPPESTVPSFAKPSMMMRSWQQHYLGTQIPPEELEEYTRIVHGYLQGELLAMSAKRMNPTLPENSRQAMAERVKKLYRMVFDPWL
jgi:AcrR family transcriptional regulator